MSWPGTSMSVDQNGWMSDGPKSGDFLVKGEMMRNRKHHVKYHEKSVVIKFYW